MTQWYVKKLSNLTNISVQTLHHYDRIGLLKPSVRLSNGYRVYSEKDVLKLQQIIALKYFGFELSRIKQLLEGEVNALAHLKAQIVLLERKAESLYQASNTLKNLISGASDNTSVPWQDIITSIEVYRMMQQLENTWITEVFTAEELKEYSVFQIELSTPEGKKKKEQFDEKWSELIKEVKSKLTASPTSSDGIALGKQCMKILNELYGEKYIHLRTKKLEEGFGEGKGLGESGLTSEVVHWLEQAVNAYWKDRVYSFLKEIGDISTIEAVTEWNTILSDMYGNDEDRKKLLCNKVLEDPNLSQEAKKIIKNVIK